MNQSAMWTLHLLRHRVTIYSSNDGCYTVKEYTWKWHANLVVNVQMKSEYYQVIGIHEYFRW